MSHHLVDLNNTMNERIRTLVRQITTLEEELREAMREHETPVLYKLQGTKVSFEKKIRELHRTFRMGHFTWFRGAEWRNVLSAPIIYSMLVPFLLFDLWLTVHHSVCFRLYGIPRVKRSDYAAVDRQHLAYLNFFEKLNCMYCGYANGLLAYAREITSRTEQYWCPIKHARKLLGQHPRCERFIDYGDSQNFHARLEQYRAGLRDER
jgi:hypothetical protein